MLGGPESTNMQMGRENERDLDELRHGNVEIIWKRAFIVHFYKKRSLGLKQTLQTEIISSGEANRNNSIFEEKNPPKLEDTSGRCTELN